MNKPPYPCIGVDWGTGDSQSIPSYIYVDERGHQHSISKERYEELHQRAEAHARVAERNRLITDYKVFTTRGVERQQWLKAQLYQRLGRPVTIKRGA